MEARAPRHRALLVSLLQLLLLGASALAYSVLVERTAGDVERYDYFTFHASARQADRGWDPYGPVWEIHSSEEGTVLGTRHPNLNPPVFIAAMMPLSRLPAARGYLVFTAATLLLALCAVPFLVTAMPKDTSRARAAMDLILLLALSFPLFLSVMLGQVGHALLLPVAIAWWALRTDREGWAGGALGVALALKVFFGLFLVMFLIGRRWKAAALMVLVGAAVSALGAIPLGWQSFGGYRETLAAVDWYSAPWNASLLGSLMRVFVWSGLSASPTVAIAGAALWAVGAGLVFVGMAVIVHRLSQSRTPEAQDAIFGVTLTAMLVLSPLSWVYYLPLLIVALIVGMRCENPRARLLVSLGWLLCVIPFNQEPLEKASTVEIFTFLGGFAGWGLLAVAGGMFLVARDAIGATERAAPAVAPAPARTARAGADQLDDMLRKPVTV